MSPILEIQHLSKIFNLNDGNETIRAITDIHLSIQEGEFVGITGKSGSGKSTILKCIHRTYLPTTGSIYFLSSRYGRMNLAQATDREMIHLRKYEMGYVSQFLNVMPRTSAWELVKLASLEMGVQEQQAAEEATRLLEHFELKKELWDRFPNTFSGGEKLRLNIAMAMVKKPRLLLLDEPTASLDAISKLRVKQLLEQLKRERTTMLGIFHDLEFMEHICDREFKMQEGRTSL